MRTKTICCKLLTNPASFDVLNMTSIAFSDACNFVLKGALEEKTHNAIKLYHLFYFDVRKLYGLSANLAVRTLRRVGGVIRMEQLKEI